MAVKCHNENSRKYVFPDVCPSCYSKVTRQADEAALRCTNTDCPAQLMRHLIHFVSRDAMDIDGLGPSVLEQLVNSGLIKSPADLYTLRPIDIAPLERMGEKSAINIINAIEKSKAREIHHIVYALGIRHIGQKAAKLLCEQFLSIEAITNASKEEILKIDGFGEVMAESVEYYFSLKRNKELLVKLENYGVKMPHLKPKKLNGVFEGKTFVLTGTLENYSRSEMTKLIEEAGGKTSSSVSKKTNYVVAGTEAGSKLIKAQNLGITILSESDVLSMLNI